MVILQCRKTELLLNISNAHTIRTMPYNSRYGNNGVIASYGDKEFMILGYSIDEYKKNMDFVYSNIKLVDEIIELKGDSV